jgi:hypothetical protein
MVILGHHDKRFAVGKKWHFDAYTLRNVEKHLYKTHQLEEKGDIWRVLSVIGPAQASGVVDGSYKRIIPFREVEFKAVFFEWMICDNIKQRQASSPRLLQLFKIANLQAAKALLESNTTIAEWVHKLFAFFEPQIIRELAEARSRISISFDEWGSKREKISVVGVVVHFLNYRYENVTRLIGLPSLPGHGKLGVGNIYPFLQVRCLKSAKLMSLSK